MDIKQLESYLLSKKLSKKEFPFGPEAAVYKVCNKMFALIGWDKDVARVNLKCDPQEAIALRSLFQSIVPGYHMNKEHWNSLYMDSSVPDDVIRKMIDDSYNLVVKGLKKADRERLNGNS